MLQGVAVTSVGRGRPRESPWGPYWGDSFRHCASPSRGQVPGPFLVGLGLWTGPSPSHHSHPALRSLRAGQGGHTGHPPNSQRSPKKPGGHWQRVALALGHLPPLWHSQPLGVPATEGGRCSSEWCRNVGPSPAPAVPGHLTRAALCTHSHMHAHSLSHTHTGIGMHPCLPSRMHNPWEVPALEHSSRDPAHTHCPCSPGL